MAHFWKLSSLLTIILLLTIVTPTLPSSSASSPIVIYTTDFEGGGLFIQDWQQFGWSRGDYASGHEDDMWCRATEPWMEHLSDAINNLSSGGDTELVAHSAGSALWSSRLGINGQNHQNNIDNGYPDPGMDSWLRFNPANAASYDGMTLTFWYWAKTQATGYTGTLTDVLKVNVNDGVTTATVWTQPSADSQGWTKATVYIPAGTVWLEWEFKADRTPSGGPYMGAFLDDVTLTDASSVAPTSQVGSLNEFYNNRTVQVPFTVNGASQVSLFYQLHGGTWTKYTDTLHTDGLFDSSPIAFTAAQDGFYDFFTLGHKAASTENMKGAPEATTCIDTIAPWTVTDIRIGDISSGSRSTMRLSSADTGSGSRYVTYQVNEGGWLTGNDIIFLPVNATTRLQFRSSDLAGNSENLRSFNITLEQGSKGVSIDQNLKGYVYTEIQKDFSKVYSCPITMLRYSLDGGNYTEVEASSSQIALGYVAAGEHSLLIRAEGSSHNVLYIQTNFTVASDTSSPSTLSLPDGSIALLGIGAFVVAAIGGLLLVLRRKQ